MCLRQFEIAELQVHGAEASMSLRIVRIEAQNGLEFGLRLAQLVVQEVKRTEIVMRFVVVWIQPNRGAKMLESLRILAKRQQRLADFGVGGGVIRVFPENALIVGNGVERQLL